MVNHSDLLIHEDHTFGQDQPRGGESRTLIVILLTLVMMAVEIAAGLAYGSMALLADGLHMGSHAAALMISYFAYVYARRRATDEQFSFGTGKVNALGGFAGGLLLVQFALFMVWESGERLLHPVPIRFEMALVVAVVGLVVNGLSALVLGHSHPTPGGHHTHDHGKHHHHGEHHHHDHGAHTDDPSHDHNLRAAYFHVLADALTSVLAILALVAGMVWGLVWLDPLIGVLGAIVVLRWSQGLLKVTAGVLLDHQAPESLRFELVDAIVGDSGDLVADLHVWLIGPGIYAAELVITSENPRSPADYKRRIPPHLPILHTTVEVHDLSQLA
ncbi:MAG: CDF family Co(II)/Ni(II) efflux transporter DmeF [Planctomycetales bacterium]|nr:CDF family Co(II)/Ni(II) efflux transporter DmeF [Planctomycetales bacterium]